MKCAGGQNEFRLNPRNFVPKTFVRPGVNSVFHIGIYIYVTVYMLLTSVILAS